jgi:hypothetical protein
MESIYKPKIRKLENFFPAILKYSSIAAGLLTIFHDACLVIDSLYMGMYSSI